MTTTHDAEWTDEDVEAALGWQHEQELRCPGCSQPRDVTFDPDAFQRFRAEPLVCHYCAARDLAARSYSQHKGDPAGVHYEVLARQEVTSRG